MKLRIVQILLGLAAGFPILETSGQMATPTVIASSGNHFDAGVVQLSWTLGESVILTMEGAQNILTNGFHQTDEFCFGDFNFDGQINTSDLLYLLAEMGCTGNCVADMDGNGLVSTSDLLIFLALYGGNCN